MSIEAGLLCADVLAPDFFTPPVEFLFFLPARAEGLYEHSEPLVKQRLHIGRPLPHLTLAVKHASQDSLSLIPREAASA